MNRKEARRNRLLIPHETVETHILNILLKQPFTKKQPFLVYSWSKRLASALCSVLLHKIGLWQTRSRKCPTRITLKNETWTVSPHVLDKNRFSVTKLQKRNRAMEKDKQRA